jgi:hypothetical protein
MWRIFFANVKAAHVGLSCKRVMWAGSDQVNPRKVHNYMMSFADLVATMLLFAPPRKSAPVSDAFAAELLRNSGPPKAIRHLAIEMKVAYSKE